MPVNYDTDRYDMSAAYTTHPEDVTIVPLLHAPYLKTDNPIRREKNSSTSSSGGANRWLPSRDSRGMSPK